MSEFFLKVVNMSISAGWIVLAVLVLRLLLKRAPKWISVLLWGIVAIRLICPFSLESVLSLIPSAETVSPEIMLDPTPSINSGVPVINSVVNPIIYSAFEPDPATSANPLQLWIPTFAVLWIAGIAGMLLYAVISYARLRRKIGTAVLLCENIYQSENVPSPFVLGIIRPRIYLPFGIDGQKAVCVIAHEKAHIKRCDHLWKPLGFTLLALHWFNPLMWLGYVLLCRDIELACDEKVIKSLGTDEKADYSEALLACSVSRRLVTACPLAFGEVGVKSRIRSVLNYKKPTFWVIVLAIAVSIAAAVCFLTSPKKKPPVQSTGSELAGVSLEISAIDASAPDPYITVKWINETDERVVFGTQFAIFYKQNGAWENCSIYEDPVWALPAYAAEPHQSTSRTYKLNGQMMSLLGSYRFEAPFTIEGKSETKYTAWVEFELEDSVDSISALTYEAAEIVYSDGAYSYVHTLDAVPTYMLVNGMTLLERADKAITKHVGTFEETTLSDETFDSRFRFQTDSEALKNIKKNNERIWQLYYLNPFTETHELYILLEQNDGTLYLGAGYYEAGTVTPVNPDDSHVRWLYKLRTAELDNSSTASLKPFFSIPELKKKYPHFFDLPTEKGLTVCVWQMSHSSYYCSLLPDKNKIPDDISSIGMLGGSATLEEMRAIVAYYRSENVPKEDIAIRAIRMPLSSYYYAIDEDYEKALEGLFWNASPLLISFDLSPVFDTASFDIDGDGNIEDCTLRFGHTSGLFTFIFTASENGVMEYYNVFHSPWTKLRFEKLDDGETVLAVNNYAKVDGEDEDTLYLELTVKDGNIVILTDDEYLWYYGKQNPPVQTD